jgi:outer membrane protein OmpA-like peptidoglycan-associated protein
MKKITIKSLLIIALAIIPMAVFAQNNGEEQAKPNNNHYWSVGFDEGATLLFGDNKTWDFKNVRPEIGIFGGYTFAKHFTVYARLSAGTVRGKIDRVLTIENASFLGADLNLSADLISLFAGYNPDRVFGLTPHVGFGQIQYQARATVRGKQVKYGYNDANGNKGKGIGGRKVVWDVPMGVRFDFNINRNVGLYLDVMTTYTDTDRLDAYASGKHYDWFSAALIGFKYNFRKADPAPAAAPAAPDCDACADAIKQAVKDAVDEALKNHPCEEPAKAEPDNTNAAAAVPFKNIDLDLTFKAGSSEVEDTDANREEIKEISDDIDAGMQFSTVKVEGYASPEGNDKQNQQLSQDRADATVAYIKDNLGDKVNDVEFESEGMGSDWDGFFKALKNSNIADKAQIEKSIRTAEDPTVKLNELRKQYTELESLLKTLRRTKVSYIE